MNASFGSHRIEFATHILSSQGFRPLWFVNRVFNFNGFRYELGSQRIYPQMRKEYINVQEFQRVTIQGAQLRWAKSPIANR